MRNVTSRPSMNESATASSQYAAGAAKGNRRRMKSVRAMTAMAGTSNQSVVLGASGESRLTATSIMRFERPGARSARRTRACVRRAGSGSRAMKVQQALGPRLLPG